MLRSSDCARGTPVLLAGGFAGLATLAACMALSAGLFMVSTVTSADSSQEIAGILSGEKEPIEARSATPSPEPLLSLDLPCDKSVRHEILPHSNITWRMEGQPGDVLSIHYPSASDSPNLNIDLQVEDKSLIQARAGTSSSDTQSFLLPQQATYSFTMISDETALNYEISLACGGPPTLPRPTPTVASTPKPTLMPNFVDLRARAAGTEAVGDIVVSLFWQSTADLDLHVIDARGEEIYYENPRSLTGGILEYEANASCVSATTEPRESIFWKAGTAPSGEYQVFVDYYGTCGDEDRLDFLVGVWIDGELVNMVEGTIEPHTMEPVHQFRY